MGRVAFLFGLAGSERLPGVPLTRLLGDLGMTHAAARTLLGRMRRQGHLETIRHGRTVDYRLAGTFAEGFRRVRSAGTIAKSEWSGSFHALLFHVPESERAYRDAFRRTALNFGYGLLQPGVLIALNDRGPVLADVLAAAPPTARIFPARLAMAPREAADAAAHAWQLPALTGVLGGHLRTIQAELRREQPPPNARTLRRFVELSATPLVDLARAPNLPPELAPPGWPLDELRAAITRLHRLYGPPAQSYTDQVLNAAGEHQKG